MHIALSLLIIKQFVRLSASKLMAFLVISVIVWSVIIQLFVGVPSAEAAAANLVPDGDIVAQWPTVVGSTGCTSHCGAVNEGVTPITTRYIATDTSSTNYVEEFSMSTAASIDSATSLRVRIYANITTVQSTVDNISLNIRINGTLQTAATLTPSAGSYTWIENTWTGNWTQTDIDSLQVELTRIVNGSGNPNNRADVIRVSTVYTEMTYTSTISRDQSAYRWFNNTNGTSVGSALAAQDTGITAPGQGTAIRLRMAIHVSIANMVANTESLKLQYAARGVDNSCDTSFSGETYADITTSTPIAFYDNPAPADGANAAASVDDPTHSGHTKIMQSYEEANNFTNPGLISVGQDGVWDFSLTHTGATPGATYCIRAVKSNNALFAAYTVIPQLTIPVPTTEQASYRWFQNAAASNSTSFSALTNPTNMPDSNVEAAEWSPNGEYLAVGSDSLTTTRFVIYKRSGDVLTKLPDPSTLPGTRVFDVSWSHDSTYLAVASRSTATDRLTVYKRIGDTFTKIADPATMPDGNTIDVTWSPDSTYLSVGSYSNAAGRFNIYKRSGDTLTKLADPAGMPGNIVYSTSWSPDGNYLVVGSWTNAADRFTMYSRSGDTFTEMADPATLPAGYVLSVQWSPNGQYLTTTSELTTANRFVIYKWNGSVLTKLSDPANMPAAEWTNVATWSPDSRFLSVGTDGSTADRFVIYERSGDTFTKITTPTPLPGNTVRAAAWSPDGMYLTTGSLVATSDRLTTYKYQGVAEVGTPLAVQSTTAVAPAQGTPFRLRLALHYNDGLAIGNEAYKLQFSARSGTCDVNFVGETYVDVSPTSGAIRYYDTPGLADGHGAISNDANNPGHSGHTVVRQTLEEANNFTSVSTITAGQDGLWDFALVDNSATGGTFYCFRVVRSNNNTLNTYTVFPELQAFTTNTAPNTPSAASLVQKTTGDATITTGQWVSATSIKFSATASDPDNSGTLQLCVENDNLATTFSNTEDLCGAAIAFSGTPVVVEVTISGIPDANEYHWQGRIKDGGGLYSSWVSYGANAESARDFGLDTTAPTGGIVYDGTNIGVDATLSTTSLSSLSANWSGFNSNVSGLNKYQYAIGTSAGATDILTWTDIAVATSVTANSLTLQTSKKYFVSVRAVDNAGNIGGGVSSDGQMVTPSVNFSVSPSTITFANLNPSNSYTDTKTTTLTTSTNAYGGYTVRSFMSDNLRAANSQTVSPFNGGTYAAPDSWQPGDLGLGYTSSDTLVAGSNRFQASTCPGGSAIIAPGCYAPFTTTRPGDVVADNAGNVSGTPLSNEQFTITYRVTAPATQAATIYNASVIYSITPIY